MHQQYMQGSEKLSEEQQIVKQQRFKYEEESHYYIDVLCDDFCEIANNDQIVFV